MLRSLKIFGKSKKYFFNFPDHFEKFLTTFRFIRYSLSVANRKKLPKKYNLGKKVEPEPKSGAEI